MIDNRDRERKALRQWEKQSQCWSTLDRRLSKLSGKLPSQTLPATINLFRSKQELSNILQSVTPSNFSPEKLWEMSLRKTEESDDLGVYYVQIGIPYPYPLYAPIRDRVSSDLNSVQFSQIVPEALGSVDCEKVVQSGYFKEIICKYNKAIKDKFPYYDFYREALSVTGMKPPISSVVCKEISGNSGYEFIPAPESSEKTGKCVKVADISKKSLLAEKEEASTVIAPHPPSGESLEEFPLVFSSTQLCCSSVPGELVQLCLYVENCGSTSVYYNWNPQKQKHVPCNVLLRTPHFELSNDPIGTVIPRERKYFVFSLKPQFAGTFSELFEFVTIPPTKIPINVHLQVFCIEPFSHAAAIKSLNNELSRRAISDAMFDDLIDITEGNYRKDLLTISNFEKTKKVLEDFVNRKKVNEEAINDKNKKKWLLRNSLFDEAPEPSVNIYLSLQTHKGKKDGQTEHQRVEYAPIPEQRQIPYNKNIYNQLEELYRNSHLIISACSAELAAYTSATLKRNEEAASRAEAGGGGRRGVEKGQTSARDSLPIPCSGFTDRHEANVLQDLVIDSTTERFLRCFYYTEQAEKNTCAGDWDGSLRSLIEQISHLKDAENRNHFLSAAEILVRMAFLSSSEEESLHRIAALLALSDALKEAENTIDMYAQLAADLVETRPRPSSPVEKSTKGGRKGGTSKDKQSHVMPVEGEKCVNAIARLVLEVDCFYSGVVRSISRIFERQREIENNILVMLTSSCSETPFLEDLSRIEILRQISVQSLVDVDSVGEGQKKKK